MVLLNLLCACAFIAAAAFGPRGADAAAGRIHAVLARPIARAVLSAALASIVALLFLSRAAGDYFPFDDSYISLSAARNVAEHFELAVVRGRPLAGVTSPLHVLVTGALGAVIGVETAARVISFAAFLAAVVVTGFYAERVCRDTRAFFLAAGLVALGGPMLFDIGNGMETSLFAALLIAAFAMADGLARGGDARRRAWIAPGLLAGLTIGARPEGAFVAAAALGMPAAIRVLRARRIEREAISPFIRAGVVALAIAAPFLIANLASTGHLLPATASAKSIFFKKGEWFFPDPRELGRPMFIFLYSAQWVGVLALAGLLAARRWAEAAFVAAFFALYLVRFPDALAHYRARYMHPLWPLLALGATGAVHQGMAAARWAWKLKIEDRRLKIGTREAAARFAGSAGGTREAWGWRVARLFFAAIVVFQAAETLAWFRMMYRQDTETTADFLMPMVEHVKKITRKTDLVAAHDVGALIYFSRRRVLDMVGLTDRSVAERLAIENAGPAAIPGILAERRPRVVVVIRDWNEGFLGLTASNPSRFHLVWNSEPNYATGAIYDMYLYR
ncbi:hypothetical protein K8I61_16950 [bacterium]|nr:hypothetical protein [bacterium]